jgi:hypothetical protein
MNMKICREEGFWECFFCKLSENSLKKGAERLKMPLSSLKNGKIWTKKYDFWI